MIKKLLMLLIYIFSSTLSYGTLARDKQDELIRKFAPIVFFHPEEKFFPVSIEFIAKNAPLKSKKDNKVVLPKGFTPDELGKFAGKAGYDYYLDFEGNKTTYAGMPLVNTRAGKEIAAPCYANIVEKANGAVIYYAFLYTYNGPLPGLGWNSVGLGTHEGDLEYIYVHLIKDSAGNYDLEKVFYAHHGAKKKGYFKSKNEIKLVGGVDNHLHPAVFAAKFGHASHNTDDQKFRLNTFDLMNGKGSRWHTYKHVINVGDPNNPTNGFKWINTTVQIGKNGPREFDWRKSDKETIEATQVQVSLNPRSGKNSKNFNLKGKVLVRAPKICWQLESAQHLDISFDVKQSSLLGRSKMVYPNIHLNQQNSQVCSDKKELNGLYISNLKVLSGKAPTDGTVNLKVHSQEY